MMNDTDRLTVGATLKKRREQLGLSLAEVARKTCIRLAFLNAIEEDRFHGFPGDAYLQGFLKAFAETLGLDARAIIAQFRQQTGIRAGESRESMPDGYDLPIMMAPRKSQPYRFLLSVAAFGALIWGLGYFAMYYGPFAGDSGRPKAPANAPPARPATGVAASEAGVKTASPATLPELPAKANPVPEALPVAEAPVSAGPPAREPTVYPLPAGGGTLRAEAIGPVEVRVRIDDLPDRDYALPKGSVLSWRIARAMELHVDAPGMLNVRLNDGVLEWSGRSELILRSPPPTVAEEGR